MYNAFFGFREKPFKLIPNPDFLFLGRSHEEALAHLVYATSQGDGFVEITGEVGTGKTTLCRVFLEDLYEDADIAFIFNSKLGPAQLLKAIHMELGIPVSSDDPVDLTASLNQFLLKKKSEGRSVILLIDEAQHLGPETLEQVRLLSNLETTRNKLIQIILVGQPELEEILDAFDMRQLRQRINLSCQIFPLTRKETGEYIDHRIKIASGKTRDLFTGRAKRLIYSYAKGTPRRINILSDRALLTAYAHGKKKVNPSMVKTAIKELDQSRPKPASSSRRFSKLIVSLILIIALGVGGIFFATQYMTSDTFSKFLPAAPVPEKNQNDIRPEPQTAPLPEKPAAIKTFSRTETTPPSPIMHEQMADEPFNLSVKNPEPVSDPQPDEVTPLVKTISAGIDRLDVIGRVLSLWSGNKKNNPSGETSHLAEQRLPDKDFFRLAGIQNNFLMVHFEMDMDRIVRFNLPTVLELAAPESDEKKYVILIKLLNENEYMVVADNLNSPVIIEKNDLLGQLAENAFITCRNQFGYAGAIAENSPKFSVLSVKLLLRRTGYGSIDLTSNYGKKVKTAVMQIQSKYGLAADGIVGRHTKLALIQEENNTSTPFLRPNIPFQTFKGGVQ